MSRDEFRYDPALASGLRVPHTLENWVSPVSPDHPKLAPRGLVVASWDLETRDPRDPNSTV